MTFRVFDREGLKLRFRDVGSGPCVFFQHGLGGTESQVAEIFPADLRVRRLTLECRGHGGSQLGSKTALSIATFADDLIALAAARRIDGAIFGGISMGAAIGLRVAVRCPHLAIGLIIARPAWLAEKAPSNLRPYAFVADLLSCYPLTEARHRFEHSKLAADLAIEAPDNLLTLRGFFDPQQPAEIATLLRAISGDGLGITEAEISRVRAPTLVIGHRADIAHPIDLAVRLAELIPTATFIEIAPKAFDRDRYVADFRLALSRFIGDFG
jgi:pimeloyl-ACP methyl ester carboxylesterase